MDMNVSGAGALAGAMNKQTFGAAVVSKTMDYMNNSSNSFQGAMAESAPMDTQTFGAAVVNKTMEYMNNDNSWGKSSDNMSQTYDLTKDVVGGYMSGKGALVNTFG